MTGEKIKKTEKVANKVPGKTVSKPAKTPGVKAPGTKAPGKTAGKTTNTSGVKTPGVKAPGAGKTVPVKTAKTSVAKTPVPGKAIGKIAKPNAKAPGAKTPGKAAIVKTAGKTAKAPGTPGKGVSPRYSMPKIDWSAFTQKMDQSLQEQKLEIIENLIASNNDFKEIVEEMDPKDFVDIASDDIDRKMIEVLGSQELRRLQMIEAAQTRIKQGKYGHCIKCDKPIPPERLEALPYALMCIDCKSEEERRNR